MCRSLQIELTVALFRVFQTLCKQGDWFSFAKRRAPSPVIPDAMVWRHPNAAIDDPRPAAGSLTWLMCDTGAEVQEEPYLDVSLLMGDDDESDDDDDACVEIPLVTPLRSAVVIPSSWNHDSRGKGVMVDDSAASSFGVSRPRPSLDLFLHVRMCPVMPLIQISFLALLVHTMPPIPEVVLLGTDPIVCKTVVDQFPTPGEMVRVESLSDDQLTVKMSVLHCMMMSHSSELLARYRGLNQSHHEYVLSADSRLKGFEEKSKAKGKERKKKIKYLGKSLDNLHVEVALLTTALNQATILKAERDEEILRLKTTPPEFSSFFWG
ncbi:hypothetical protein Tco_0921551 [Tanacetum coccineum]